TEWGRHPVRSGGMLSGLHRSSRNPSCKKHMDVFISRGDRTNSRFKCINRFRVMRIIGGRLGGLRLTPPNKLPVRPTTDLAKEALFNILEYRLDCEGLYSLGLCCGTGNIPFELASRGVHAVDAIEIQMKCLLYIKATRHKHTIENIQVRKADIF